MNELLGIALEFAEARRRLANRLSPLARRLAFPDLYERHIAKRKIMRPRKIRPIEPANRIRRETKAAAIQAEAEKVVNVCARIFEVPVGQIYDASRKAIYVRPRQAAAALMTDVLGLSLPVTGLILNRDHTTIMYALRTHSVRHATDAEYRRRFTAAEEEVRALFPRNATTSDTVAAGDEVDAVPRTVSLPSPAIMQKRAA